MRNMSNQGGVEHLDRPTSEAICNAIGERLRRDVAPSHALPDHLQSLIAQFEMRERQGR